MVESAKKPKTAKPPPDAGHIPMTEEMDSARWTLPPVLPVAVVAAVLAVIVGAYTWHARPKPLSTGVITNVFAVEQADKSGVMVMLHLRLQNTGEKPLWVRQLRAQLKTDQGEWSDEAAAAVDHPRYFQAFPELGKHGIAPLKLESRIEPGAQQDCMMIVAFPVNKEAFDKRKGLSVTLEAYDRRPMVIEESGH